MRWMNLEPSIQSEVSQNEKNKVYFDWYKNQSVNSVASNSLRPQGLQHARLSCPSPTPRVYSNSCPLSWWCHSSISSSVVPFSSCLQSFPALGSFQMSQFFASYGQSIGVSASVLPMNTQDWSPLGWTGWISLQSKGLSRVFSNTTVQKHQFFGSHPSRSSQSTRLSSLCNTATSHSLTHGNVSLKYMFLFLIYLFHLKMLPVFFRWTTGMLSYKH